MSKWLSWPTDPDERVSVEEECARFNAIVRVGDPVMVTLGSIGGREVDWVEGEVIESAGDFGGAYVAVRVVGEDDDHYPLSCVRVRGGFR